MRPATRPPQARHSPTAGPAELDLTDAELRTEIARLAGLLAHRCGVSHAFTVLMRIAGALGPTGGRA